MSAQLAHFVEAARQGSKKNYVANSGYTYNNVHNYIRQLEKEVGCKLFTSYEGELTPAGETFLPYAERSLAASEERDWHRAVEIETEGRDAIRALETTPDASPAPAE